MASIAATGSVQQQVAPNIRADVSAQQKELTIRVTGAVASVLYSLATVLSVFAFTAIVPHITAPWAGFFVAILAMNAFINMVRAV